MSEPKITFERLENGWECVIHIGPGYRGRGNRRPMALLNASSAWYTATKDEPNE